MSGIILPGQPKKPQSSSGGFEIASGFVKKKDPKPAEQPTEKIGTEKVDGAPTAQPETPAVPAATAPTALQRPQQARRSAQDFMFPPQAAQVQCPQCATPYNVPIFSIIDLGVNPELRQPLLSGQVNMAQCPSCGMGGPLSAPLMVHAPTLQWLGIFIAAEARINETQRQKVIGDLTQALMRKLPTEARKGYMLQPKQYSDWQRFSEKIWELEGVTPEMLRRQRDQSALLQNLMVLANDRKALEIAIQQRGGDLIDRTFFAMLDRMLMIASQQGQGEQFAQLRNQLLEMTEAGKQVKALTERVRAILGTINQQTTRDQLLNILVDASAGEDAREVTAALVSSLAPALDYEFLLKLGERVEKSSDDTVKQRLEEVRQMVLTIHEQQRSNQQAIAQQVQQILQKVLEATDVDAGLREVADYIDETFLAVLGSNIQAAEQRGSKAAAGRLQHVYDRAVAMLEESMPPEMRLINHLLSADDRSEIAKLLGENRSLLTPDFVESLKRLETEMRTNRRDALADRLKSLRGQISLMV